MPKIISLLNQKGGAGKTTSSTNIASQLHKSGHSVMLVDLDAQGSASKWSAAKGEDDDTFPVIAMGKNLARDLPRIARDYEYIIIDGAPQVSELAAVAIKVSDSVIIPVQPSPYDVWACSDLVELIQLRQEVTDGKPKAAFLITMAMQTNITSDVREIIRDYDLPLLENCTHRTTFYAETAAKGLSVIEAKATDSAHKKAQKDIEKVTAEILEFTHG